MNYIIFYLVAFGTFIIGVFGFSQIIGSLRARQRNFLIPIIIWISLLLIIYFAFTNFIPNFINALYIGYILSFLIVISQSKIE